MDIWSTDKLALFVLFVVPGFICLKTYQAAFPRVDKDASQQLVDAVAYGALNFGIFAGPIMLIENSNTQNDHPVWYALFYFVVLFVAPTAEALVFGWLRKRDWLQNLLPHPTGRPWDYLFGRRGSYWVIVTLRDGKRMGGRYDSNSFASSSPDPQELFLEEAWVLNADGGFERPRSNSAGLMILSPDIATLEFFTIQAGGPDDQEADHQ